MSEKTGVLGGSFNPVHLGHLILARDAREAFDLDRVLLLPCSTPPHKQPGQLLPAMRRLDMLKLAVEDDPTLEVSTVELDHAGVSYSVDTLERLTRQFADATFYFIIGADTLTELHTWRRIYDLLNLCEMVAMRRPGYPWRLSPADLKLDAPWPERLLANRFEGHEIGISASEIRSRIAAGRDIRYLVPEKVEAYIVKNGLYRTPEV